MNWNWITQPLALYGVIAVAAATALHLFISAKADLRRQALRHASDSTEMRDALCRLQARMDALALEAERETRLRAAISTPLPRGINLHKRAEALRLCRRGADLPAIAARLGLSRAEARLLHQVHQTLACEPLVQPGGSLQERSNSLEYSFEA